MIWRCYLWAQIEERDYPVQNWVCTKRMAARDGEDQTTGMFWRLFSYIQGANQEEAKIPMTTPVTTSVTPTPEVRNITTVAGKDGG